MGTRVRNNLAKLPNKLFLIEMDEEKRKNIKNEGYESYNNYEPIKEADLTVLAVPDKLIKVVSKDVVPHMKANSTLILLDPAAAYMGEVAKRDDCTFVITHPCHPQLFMEQETPEAKADMFGGVAAKHDIVIALDSGEEENFEKANDLCKIMFAPVMNSFRITVKDMAILEPAAAEVVVACAAHLMRQALDEAVKRGVPEEAAKSFLLGHVRIPLAVFFDKTDFPISDAAKIAVEIGYEKVVKDTWRDVYNDDMLEETIRKMLSGSPSKELW
jgi:hypothetical protein